MAGNMHGVSGTLPLAALRRVCMFLAPHSPLSSEQCYMGDCTLGRVPSRSGLRGTIPRGTEPTHLCCSL